MAVIYLKHPVHGSKVASSDFEVEHDKEHGWEVYDPTAKTVVTVEPVIKTPVVVEPVIETPDWLVAPEKKKPGRKPKSAQ